MKGYTAKVGLRQPECRHRWLTFGDGPEASCARCGETTTFSQGEAIYPAGSVETRTLDWHFGVVGWR